MKKYQNPEIELFLITEDDVIKTSPEGGLVVGGDGNGWGSSLGPVEW
jgi:hypothetical protein